MIKKVVFRFLIIFSILLSLGGVFASSGPWPCSTNNPALICTYWDELPNECNQCEYAGSCASGMAGCVYNCFDLYEGTECESYCPTSSCGGGGATYLDCFYEGLLSGECDGFGECEVDCNCAGGTCDASKECVKESCEESILQCYMGYSKLAGGWVWGRTPLTKSESDYYYGCSDGWDNDCDGVVDLLDPDCGGTICLDSDLDGYNVTGGTCGIVDCNDSDSSIYPGAVEICADGEDNDCDGEIDEGECETTGGGDCDLTNAYWNTNVPLDEGEPVFLVVEGVDCDEKEISFEVKEYDESFVYADDDVVTNPNNIFIEGNSWAGVWIAEEQDDEDEFTPDDYDEYYFIATVVENPDEKITSNDPKLLVNIREPLLEECSEIATCANYNETNCEDDPCTIALDSASVECGYTQDCDTYNNCKCVWDEDEQSCESAYEVKSCAWGIPDSGICIYDEDTADNCDDGFLSYSWDATWQWYPENSFAINPDPVSGDYVFDGSVWRYDPKDDYGVRQSEDCVDGSDTLPCPAKIQLPFFTWINLIITILVIILIYILLNKKRKLKR